MNSDILPKPIVDASAWTLQIRLPQTLEVFELGRDKALASGEPAHVIAKAIASLNQLEHDILHSLLVNPLAEAKDTQP